MANVYSDGSTRSAILSAAVAQFSYFQAAEPTDMAAEELWYNSSDFIIRRFVDGEWIERGTYIPVNQQRCIVLKQAVISDVTVTGPVYVIRDGNEFTTAPLYVGGLEDVPDGYESGEIDYVRKNTAVVTYADIKTATVTSTTSHDSNAVHVDDVSGITVGNVFEHDGTYYYIYGLGGQSAPNTLLIQPTLKTDVVEGEVILIQRINSVEQIKEWVQMTDGVWIPVTTRQVEGGTETINAAFLNKYLPTVIGMGDAKRFLAADSEHDPYWEEFPELLQDTDSEFVNMTRRAGVWVPVSSCVRTETINLDTMPVGQRAAVVLDGTVPEELMQNADSYWAERYDFNYDASGIQRHLQTLTATKDDESRIQMFKRLYKADTLGSQGTWDSWVLFYDSQDPPSPEYITDTGSEFTHMTRIHGLWTPIASCQIESNIELDTMPAGQELAGMTVSDTAPADIDPEANHFWVQRYDHNYEGSGAIRHIQTLNAYNLSANPIHVQSYKRLYTQEGPLQPGVWHEWIKVYDSEESTPHAVWSTAATPRAIVGQTITVTIGTKVGTVGGDTAAVGDQLILFDTAGVWGVGMLNSITNGVYTALVVSTTAKPEDLFGALPTTDGDYIPHLTVSGGVATYSWEVNL